MTSAINNPSPILPLITETVSKEVYESLQKEYEKEKKENIEAKQQIADQAVRIQGLVEENKKMQELLSRTETMVNFLTLRVDDISKQVKKSEEEGSFGKYISIITTVAAGLLFGYYFGAPLAAKVFSAKTVVAAASGL